jgi:hypothetical protein
VAIAADISGSVLLLEPERKVSWRYEPRAFERICNIVDDLLIFHQVTGRHNRHGISRNPTATKAITKGTGLLHYLVYCPRLQLREQAFEFAQKLLEGDTSMETAADRQTDSHGVSLSPFVNVNDELRASDLKFGNPDRAAPDLILGMETPLHMAVSVHSKKMVWLLLQYGADPEKVGRSGLTPYGLAKKLVGWETMVDIIEENQGKGLKEGSCVFWDWWKGKDASVDWAQGSRLQRAYIDRMEEEWEHDNMPA